MLNFKVLTAIYSYTKCQCIKTKSKLKRNKINHKQSLCSNNINTYPRKNEQSKSIHMRTACTV